MLGVPLVADWFSDWNSHDLARIVQVAVFAGCAASLLHRELAWDTHRWTAPKLFAVLIVHSSLCLLSCGSASEPVAAFRELSLFLGLATTSICIAQADFYRRASGQWAATVIGTSLYSFALMGLVIATMINGSDFRADGLFFGYDNYRFYSHVQTICLPLLAVVATGAIADKRLCWVAAPGLAIGFALLMLAVGRATASGLIISIVVSLLAFGSHALRFVVTLVIGALAGGILFATLMFGLRPYGSYGALSTFEKISNQGSYDARLFLWRLAADYIEESPWLGIGPMHYAHRINIEAAHPHNIYLQISAEWGVPMLLLILSVLVWAFWRFRQRIKACRNASDRTIGIGLFAACTAVAVDGFFSGNFVMPISQMWIAFLVGISIAWSRSQAPLIPKARAPWLNPKWQRPARVGLATMLVGSQFWLLYSMYPEAVDITEHIEFVYRELAPNPRINPRFWSHGWF